VAGSGVPRRFWLLLPAVTVSLGWGLRGYIGGGPFGAMIPGALLAVVLCQLLGYRALSAAWVAAFAAIGIGFGGEMTYGQTLGLFRNGDTFWWGLAGTTIKGAVWGLLGGAILGLGFTVQRLSRLQLRLLFAALLAGVMVGIHLINVPRLIYFSDPVRPRDESWAGFLLGGLAVLACLRGCDATSFSIASRFGLSGALGGAVGFGGGSLLLAAQFHVPPDWRWLPYWKLMEFAFGLLLGAALGDCAFRLRQRLAALEPAIAISPQETSQGHRFRSCFLAGVLVLLGVFVVWPWLESHLIQLSADIPESDWRTTGVRVLFGFTGLGCLLMLLGRHWPGLAWQVAISVTIAAAANDLQRDLLPHGGIELPAVYRAAMVVLAGGLSAVLVAWWQAAAAPRLQPLFNGTAAALMLFAYLMGSISFRLWWTTTQELQAAGKATGSIWTDQAELLLVHPIFTGLFIASLLGFARINRSRR
jgi:hypothetical protein